VNLPLDFHPAVRDEIDQAHGWYEQRLSGLERKGDRHVYCNSNYSLPARLATYNGPPWVAWQGEIQHIQPPRQSMINVPVPFLAKKTNTILASPPLI
jgi:hypothetical protein